MTKKSEPKTPKKPAEESGVSRREFFTKGAAAGVLGAAALGSVVPAEAAESRGEINWDYEADVVVLGGGGTGLAAANRAHDLGASVLVLEQSFDIGGKMSHSGGWTSLGGGDAIQERDRLGLDPQNMGLTAPLLPPEDLTDDPDLLFKDVTDWSVVNDAAIAEYRYNDRDLHRAWADNAPAVRQFLMDNYVRFSRVSGTHLGGGMSKARAPWAVLKLADKTDIEAGTITLADKGDGEKSSPFNPMYWPPGPSAGGFGAPGWVFGGFVVARSLEYSARKKGVRFMVNRHLDEIIRENGTSGRVIGVRASYSPRYNPETGERLESYWNNGNVEEKKEVIFVRARKAVIVGTGGYMGNIPFRTQFDPRMSEPSIQYGNALMGPRNEDASGILAGLRVGAGLGGLLQPYGHAYGTPRLESNIGTPSTWDATFPGHPAFLFLKSSGLQIGTAGWEHVIIVNQVGQRFYNETSLNDNVDTNATYPPGASGTNNPFTALDWRNSSVDHIRKTYNRGSAIDAAMAINEASRGPEWSSGPVWAIFDQAAVDRNGWEMRYPYLSDNGFYFKADTLSDLARLVVGNPYQHTPLRHLEDTVSKYNGFASAGKDTDFEKPVLHSIDKPPFYAVLVPMSLVDSYGGLRINGKAQVVDMGGQPIPGLYAGGEASGGGRQHGIGRATVTGYIAATSAVGEAVS